MAKDEPRLTEDEAATLQEAQVTLSDARERKAAAMNAQIMERVGPQDTKPARKTTKAPDLGV